MNMKEEQQEEEDHKLMMIKSSYVFQENDEKMVMERCPDLNLDLKISPPHPHQTDALKTGGRNRGLCFACSLGLQNSKDCSCNSNNGTSSSNNGTSGYDFLGLKAGGVLDYRSLEMK